MLKKFSFLSMFLFSLIFLACKASEEKEITLVMAEVNPEDTVVGRMDTAFKEKVEELSNGKIKIDLKFSGIIGDEKQSMQLVRTPDSQVHIMRGPANLSSFANGKPVESNLISIPYTFKDDDHFWKFASSQIAQDMLNEPYEMGLGVKGLFFAEEGFRHYFSNHKIENVKDLKGKKMRVSGQTLTELANALGSEAIEVPFTDLYAYLFTGKIEIAEQPLSNYYSNSFYQVAPYLILDGHMLGAVSVMINSQCWDSLSVKQKKILTDAGKYAQEYCRKILEDANEKAIADILAAGVTITEVKDITEWQKACLDMREKSSKSNPDLYKKILDLSK